MPVFLAAAREPEQVREAARDILGRPEFREPADGPAALLELIVTDPIGALVYGFMWLVAHFPDGTAGSIIAWLVAALAAAVVVLLLFRFTRTVDRGEVAPVSMTPALGEKTPQELNAEADQLEGAGEWRAAIRARYAAAIAQFDADGLVRRRPGRTTGEYLREVSANAPSAAVVFGSATELFESVWYGDAVPTADDAQRFRALVRDTLQSVNA